ncbi:M61 family metallopeptidase [Frateuria aurantia]
MKRHLLTCAMLAAMAALPAHADVTGPAPASALRDTPYPGTLQLSVDLSRAPDRLYRVQEVIPASAGPLTLYYPQWIPGEHSPSGPIENVAGLVIKANGKVVPWRRDLKDMYALHVDAPTGTTQLDLSFEFLSPGDSGLFGAGASATPKLVDLEFNQVAFYPAGYTTRQIPVQPSVTLPDGWKYGTALQKLGMTAGSTIRFDTVPFNTLVDSPLVAGAYYSQVDLAPGAATPVHLNIVGDSPENLKIKPETVTHLRSLVSQAYALFGAHHYAHYDFLLTLSDSTDHFGLEHHQSSDDRLPADSLTDEKMRMRVADLMPHEYVHSWNGKYRRPADLATPNFNVPMQDDLLWVYEGLTEYWGPVLTARSGLWTVDQFHDEIASIYAQMDNRAGRQWRSLQDTADAAPLTYYGGSGWGDYRRGTDFYPEGTLLWLDVDTKIRELSGGKHSLDDFAKAFYGMNNGDYKVLPYTFEQVVAALNAVQPFGWADFLRTRLDATGTALPEADGLARAGWKVVYSDKPSAYDEASSSLGHGISLMYSAGLTVSASGSIRDVRWGGPAFAAGLVPGMTITAVDGKTFSTQGLSDAIVAAGKTQAPIALIVRNGDYYSTVQINYHGGLRYPHLEAIKGAPDRLGQIIKAKS